MARLTTKRLLAMQEALISRLAGEIEQEILDEGLTFDVYEGAADWVSEQLQKRWKAHDEVLARQCARRELGRRSRANV